MDPSPIRALASPSPYDGSNPDEFISMRRSAEVEDGTQIRAASQERDGTLGQTHGTAQLVNSSDQLAGTVLQQVKTTSSSGQSRYASAASSMPSGPSVIVGTQQQSVEFATMPNAKGQTGKESQDFEVHGKDADAAESLSKITQEIVNLYLKIKRCSKDVNITESQYLEQVETAEDREERLLIAKMDPMIVLQYINVSIDVIINLKFEDIENKMAESAVKRMDHDKKNGSRPQRDDRGKKQVAREK
jgi:hypothetical protein